MFAAFDKLAEMEEAEAVAQQAALDQFAAGAKAIRADGQEYLEGASDVEAAALKQGVSAAVEAPVLNFAGSDSPPSSGGHTPPSDSEFSGSASADEMEQAKFSSSSLDSSPAGSPKKGVRSEEKEEVPAANLSSAAEPFASQSPAPAKKGFLGKLFGNSKKPSPPALPAKPVVSGQNQGHQAPAFK